MESNAMDDMTRRDAILAAATGVIAGSVPGPAAGAERGGASRPEERAAGDYLILACDGGGYRGLLSALILERIEKQSPFLDRVNLFAGTSTGGFIAIGLASGMSIAEVVNLYRDNGTTIFGGAKPDPEVEPTSRIGKIWAAIRNREEEVKESLGFSPKDLLKSKYKADGLKAVLTKAFGENATFSDLKQGRSLLVTTLRLSSEKGWAPLVLHNLGVGVATTETRVVDGPTPETRLVDAALATSAAPLYFPPHPVEGFGYCVDGGLFANCPSGVAYALAKRTLAESRSRIRILSIGTGAQISRIDIPDIPFLSPEDYGAAAWLSPVPRGKQPDGSKRTPAFPLISALFDAGSASHNYICRQVLGPDYLRIQVDLPNPIPLDAGDAKATKAIQEAADRWLSDQAAKGLKDAAGWLKG
jgi:uncharacterized protein